MKRVSNNIFSEWDKEERRLLKLMLEGSIKEVKGGFWTLNYQLINSTADRIESLESGRRG